MKRWRKIGIVALFSVAAVFFIIAGVRHRQPVLFHISGSCACTDYSEEVEGWTLFNPLRDRSPEASGNAFLEAIKQGRCPVAAPNSVPVDCAPGKLKPIPVEWRLRYRRDQPHLVSLYYQFTRLNGEPYPRWGGEGTVQVIDIDGTWKTSFWDVTW
jgi:hypothetical protein